MLALLIKPAAMKKSRYRKIIKSLLDQGNVTLKSHTASLLTAEIGNLQNQHPDLTIVACGGDGTVNLAVNAIANLSVKFAVLPMGTGNDFARHLGLKNLNTALQAINQGKVLPADLGEVQLIDGHIKYFAAVASCGFDAQVNEVANKMVGPNGPIKYLAAVFRQLRQLNPIQVTVKTIERELVGRFTLVAIGNTSSYGGGMQITPAAQIADGQFALTIVDAVNRRTLVKVLPQVFIGRHVFHPKVSVDQTSRVHISGDAFPVYADGERLGLGPATFTVLPARLRILVP